MAEHAAAGAPGTSDQPELAPEVVGFLHKIEQYAATLPDNENAALLRLIRAGLMTDEATAQQALKDDTQGFGHGYNYGYGQGHTGYGYQPYYTYQHQQKQYYTPYYYTPTYSYNYYGQH